MRDYELHTLANGIRIIHKQVSNSKIAHCGFVLDIGSRDEKPHQLGIAHFWEHMAFKGTRKRKAYHIINKLESVGGELNAYTTKEKICFHASVLENHFEKALDLLSDITFQSTFPEREIQKERGVILEEMSMYLDDPADAILDHFDELYFGEHQLGHNILGSRASVSSFQRNNFHEFIQENLNSERLVFSSVSALPFKKIKEMAERYLADLPHFDSQHQRIPFESYQPARLEEEKPLMQAHCVIGGPAYGLHDKRRIPFFMLNNILGGPGMNSRLNLSLREKYGLVYGIDSSYNIFLDTGNYTISFATDKGMLERCISLITKEMQKLKQQALGSLQLHRAKEQLMGQLAMAEESNLGLMLMMGKAILDQGRIESLDEIFEIIRNITAADLLHIANQAYDESYLSQLIYKP